jgi:hypothetical protein
LMNASHGNAGYRVSEQAAVGRENLSGGWSRSGACTKSNCADRESGRSHSGLHVLSPSPPNFR